MKLILNRIDDSFVTTKSKNFKLNGLLWHMNFTKWFDGEQDIFEFKLRCGEVDWQTLDDWSCELSVNLKLMPVNADFETIEECYSFTFDENEKGISWKIVEWSELEKRFVKNESIDMAVELEVKN